MSESKADDEIILEASPNDVLLGRGNAVNFREGNVRFRKLAQTKALRYATCSNKHEKDKIAESIVMDIKSQGGRFLRPIAAKNDKGEHLSAWEAVEEEVALTKAKQTLRDCAAAIRRETAMRSTASPPSFDSLTPPRTMSGTLQRPQDPASSSGLPTSHFSMHDGSFPAFSMLQRQGMGPASSMLDSLLSGNAEQPRTEVTSRQHLEDQQERLLQILRQQQIPRVNSSESSTFSSSGNNVTGSVFRPGDAMDQGASIVRRAREIMLIEQYQREQAIAEAQKRLIWEQLSSQTRAHYQSSFLQQPQFPIDGAANTIADESLRRLLDTQRLLQGSNTNLSGLGINPQHLQQESLTELAQNEIGQVSLSTRGEARAPERKSPSVGSKQSHDSFSASSSSSSEQSSRPLKKRRGLPKTK